jgi:hypothetical protein
MKVAKLFAELGDTEDILSAKKGKSNLNRDVPYLLTVLLAFLMFCSESELPQVSYRKVHLQKYLNISESLNVPKFISNDNHPPNQH